jgi:hypothetical protein
MRLATDSAVRHGVDGTCDTDSRGVVASFNHITNNELAFLRCNRLEEGGIVGLVAGANGSAKGG